MESTALKKRTREEIQAWWQRAKERKAAWEKKTQAMLAEEAKLQQQAADSHYYDIAVK